MPAAPHGRVASAMRIAAALWFVAALIGLGLDLWQQSMWDDHQAGADLTAVLDDLQFVAWLSQGNHVVSTTGVAIAASLWSRGRPLVRIGQGLLSVSLLVGIWLVVVRSGQTSSDELGALDHVATANVVAFFSGLSLLLAPTAAPRAARVGFPVLAAGWLVYTRAFFEPSADVADYAWMFSAIPIALAAVWSAGMLLGAPHEADPSPEAPAGGAADDPSRMRAADGVALVRLAMVSRVVLAIGLVALLVAVRQNPGSSSMVVWLGALVQCGIAVVLAVGLTQYGSLPDRAIERGHITTVVVCLAIAAMLELYGATQASVLFDVMGRANRGDFSRMPSVRDLEATQTHVLWIGRFGTVVGIVAAVSLAISLRQTAVWLDDVSAVSKASTLAVLTILGGGGAGVLVAVAQSGALKGLGAIVGAMLAGLVLAIAILSMWLGLLSRVIAGLRQPPRSP